MFRGIYIYINSDLVKKLQFYILSEHREIIRLAIMCLTEMC